MELILSSPLIFILCAIVGLQIFIMFIEPHKRYQQYVHKKKLQKLFGELSYQKVLRNRNRISEKIVNIPIVSLANETLSAAEELLGIEVEPVCFDDSIIASEIPFIQSTLPKDSKKMIAALIKENQLPIRVYYNRHTRGIDDFQTHVDSFYKKKYFTTSDFHVSELISTTFAEEILKKEIVLFGICDMYATFDSIIVLLIPFQREQDENSAIIAPLPAFPEVV